MSRIQPWSRRHKSAWIFQMEKFCSKFCLTQLGRHFWFPMPELSSHHTEEHFSRVPITSTSPPCRTRPERAMQRLPPPPVLLSLYLTQASCPNFVPKLLFLCCHLFYLPFLFSQYPVSFLKIISNRRDLQSVDIKI